MKSYKAGCLLLAAEQKGGWCAGSLSGLLAALTAAIAFHGHQVRAAQGAHGRAGDVVPLLRAGNLDCPLGGLCPAYKSLAAGSCYASVFMEQSIMH